jgi:hypothetical protein
VFLVHILEITDEILALDTGCLSQSFWDFPEALKENFISFFILTS